MTRYVMVADLNRCVGCQTCTAACKHSNATPPGVQWRKVLDLEWGEYPDVERLFMPVGCQHCADPPCMHVCPSTATAQRDDGIVTIDYDLCIGCSYCTVACPYQARYKADKPRFAFGDAPTETEARNFDERRLGVAQKCTFCSDRVDSGVARGLKPGVDPEATPACVNACIADALSFGDIEDGQSNVSELLAENTWFQMHAELGTEPGFYYLWQPRRGDEGASRLSATPDDEAARATGGGGGEAPVHAADDIPAVGRGGGRGEASGMRRKTGAHAGQHIPARGGGGEARGMRPPKQNFGVTGQTQWDLRAAGNFVFAGSGAALLSLAAVDSFPSMPALPVGLSALFLVGLGLLCVWLEIGRPWRFLHVFFHPQTSWMTREAAVAMVLFATAAAGLWLRSPLAFMAAGVLGLLFLSSQGLILRAAKGIPAWREPAVVPLFVSTGLAEGAALLCLFQLAATREQSWLLYTLAGLLLLRVLAWHRYRRRLAATAEVIAILNGIHRPYHLAGNLTPLLLLLSIPLLPPLAAPFGFAAAVLVLLGGWGMKLLLITRAAKTQGYALGKLHRGRPPIKPPVRREKDRFVFDRRYAGEA